MSPVLTICALVVGCCCLWLAGMSGSAHCSPSVRPAAHRRASRSGEDCDAEDWANREADCGFVKPKPAGTPVKVPARPPAPRNTRR